MEEAQHERLVKVMARLATGDRQAVFTLYTEFGVAMAGVLRRELARLGCQRLPAEDLDGLVIDACLEVASVARAWDPDRGAAPWTWALRRLTRLASDYVGIHAGPLPEDWVTRPEGHGRGGIGPGGVGWAEELEPWDILERLASRHRECRLLLDALARVSTPRNRDILLEVRLQATLGDPAPAVTVGRSFGLRPEAVRQVVKRTRDALGRLAAEDPQFASLATIALVA